MKKTTRYLGIEEVIYEFDLSEIYYALIKHFKIKTNSDYEFDVYEAYNGNPAGASLVIKYTKENNPNA